MGRSRGRVQGLHTPLPPLEMTRRLFNMTGIVSLLRKIWMCTPPKKNILDLPCVLTECWGVTSDLQAELWNTPMQKMWYPLLGSIGQWYLRQILIVISRIIKVKVQCKCYQPKPKAEGDDTCQDLDYSGYHKTESNNCFIIHYFKKNNDKRTVEEANWWGMFLLRCVQDATRCLWTWLSLGNHALCGRGQPADISE